MVHPDPVRRRAIVALVLVNLLWGISFPVMKAANMIMEEHVANADSRASTETGLVGKLSSASFLTVVRFVASLLILGVSLPRLFLRMNRSQWLMGVWTGLVFAPGFLLQNVALNFVPASRSGFLTSLCVVFTPMLMIAVDRRLPRRAVVAGVAIALLGTTVLTGLFEFARPLGVRIAPDALVQIGLGDWLTISAAFIFAIQIILIDRFSRRMPAGQLTPGMFVATLVVGSALWFCGHAMQPPTGRVYSGLTVWGSLIVDMPFLALILVLSVFCTVLAFYWMNKYQAHVTPAQAAIIYTLEPIFATLWAMTLPNALSMLCNIEYAPELPGVPLVVGGLLVVAGNALALGPEKRPQN